eukprot:m.207740 g.207740  ORF g.207740 m.207740 type:complete len:93 (+) comp39697_c1_seq12:346-624(+)
MDEKFNDMVESSGGLFYPLVVETLGMWTPSSLPLLKIIAFRTAISQNQSLGEAVKELHERLSVGLWKWNARMILSRLCLSGTVVLLLFLFLQ